MSMSSPTARALFSLLPWTGALLIAACSTSRAESLPQGTTSSSAGASTGAGAGPGSSSSSGSGGSGGTAPIEPAFESIPWEEGGEAGYGVAFKDAHNPRGENVFIGYAGYNITRAGACAWATELYKAVLRDKGVRYVYCVQGPADPLYSQYEIGNTKIGARLLTQVGPKTKFALVLAHSSGSFVAHELFYQLTTESDPQGVTQGKIVYFNLDGGAGGLDQPIVQRLRKAYFVAAHDGVTVSPNYDGMAAAGQTYAAAGGFYDLDAAGSGCAVMAKWCVHMTLINTHPHDLANPSAADYTDFNGRPVARAFLDAKADEAGIVP